MDNTIISELINLILVGIGGFLVREIVVIVPHIIKLIVAKIGLNNYTKNKAIAWDIWLKIEEDGRLGELVESKVLTFEKLIKKAIPSITDADILLFNKAIAGEYNKDKAAVIKEIEAETIVATPVIKYFAQDGVTELVPAVAPGTGV